MLYTYRQQTTFEKQRRRKTIVYQRAAGIRAYIIKPRSLKIYYKYLNLTILLYSFIFLISQLLYFPEQLAQYQAQVLKLYWKIGTRFLRQQVACLSQPSEYTLPRARLAWQRVTSSLVQENHRWCGRLRDLHSSIPFGIPFKRLKS